MTNRLRVVFPLLLLAAFTTVCCTSGGRTAELHVAAAANLQNVLTALAQSFQSQSETRVIPTMGATAQLTQQIENGAPIDLFLAADSQHVDQLVSQQLADPTSRAVYARGRLVLWAPSRPDITRLEDLASDKVQHVGCARPELAPYGAAAIESLKKSGLWSAVEPKLVYGQSISAAKQFADSGNTDASFTALSLVIPMHGETPGHYVPIDENLHAPIDQALCIVKQAAQPALARRFRDFVLSPEGRSVLARFGYALP